MDQFVIRTGSKEMSSQYLSKRFLGGYFYTEKADIYNSKKDVNLALSWAKKDKATHIKRLKEDIVKYKKEVEKGNITINKVLLQKSKEWLKEYESFNFKVKKL